ncbi:MAG TPA: SCO family protein [Candidatus Aquilonibacter sp.]|nr:SCO family protein [Candidatus Aquilonibacter sp.]
MKHNRFHFRHSNLAAVLALGVVIALAGLPGCSRQASQSSESAESEQVPANAKVYHLHGKVISVDQQNSSLTIDGDEVPGFMAAMTMPYPVKYKGDMSKAAPGDEITADIIVPQGDESPYIQNIVVVKKGNGAAPSSASTDEGPQPGESVPDFSFINQDGKRIHLASYRGQALLITFIYTRCPFPNFCPLVSRNFAKIYADTKANAELTKNMRLLSVSFDPDHDTPAVLRAYAKTFYGTTDGTPYGRWEFAVIPKDELKQVTSFFGVTITDHNGQIVHSMSTSVITPDGKIYSWREDTDWHPQDLIADATAALSPDAAQATPADMRGAGHPISGPSTN